MKVLKVGDLDCKVGESAQENWTLLDRAKKKHWFFHLTDFPSCYVVLECEREPSREEKYRCAEICVENTKQRKSKRVKVDATPCSNVLKSDAVGECEYRSEKKVEEIVVKEVSQSAAEPPKREEEPAPPPPRIRDPTRGAGGEGVSSESISVRKHASLGCAVITFQKLEERARLLSVAAEFEIGSIKVKLQPQVEKSSGSEVQEQLFASWGRQVEKAAPLEEEVLLGALEALLRSPEVPPEEDRPPPEEREVPEDTST